MERTTRRRWIRRLLVLAVPAAALPVTLIAPAEADSVACVEVSTDPLTCGTGNPVGVAVCGVAGDGDPAPTNIDPSAADGSAAVSVNAGVAGFDSSATGIGGTSPQGYAVVWVDGTTHAGIGSTTGGNVQCP